MLLRIGNRRTGVDFIVPVMIDIQRFSWASIFFAYALFSYIGEQYSAAEHIRPTEEVLSELKSVPRYVLLDFFTMWLREPVFLAKLVKRVLYVRVLSNVAQRYLGRGSCFTSCPQKVRLWIAVLLLKWIKGTPFCQNLDDVSIILSRHLVFLNLCWLE